MKNSKTGDDDVEGCIGKAGEDLDDRLPLSRLIPKMLVKKKNYDVSSAVVGDHSEGSGKGSKGYKTAPGKNVPPSSKTASSGKGTVLPHTNVVVVMSDDDSENDEFFGSDVEVEGLGGGEEWKEPEIPAPKENIHTSYRDEVVENVERNAPNKGTVGGSVFTFSGAACDL